MNNPTFKPGDCLILIVDDDRTMRNLLKIAMEEDGYRVIEAKNGQQGLEEYHRHHPDMVLLDALMPDMDGFTCCQKLRSVEDNASVPILMITALDDQNSIDQAFVAGATDYITKPIFWSVLSQRVHCLLLNSQTAKQLRTLTSQCRRQQQWQILGHHITRQWQHPFELKSLFQDFVGQLQSHLKAERVGIHRMDGRLMAEVVAPGYPSVKTLKWEKITLLGRYQSKYDQGDPIILDFSKKLDLSEKEIAPLERLSVQHIILSPLLFQDNLWGILWVHYCRSSDQWEAWEIDCLSHLSDLLAITSKTMEVIKV
ncbi:MAG: response regulator [Crocosphaera sp.]